MLKWAEWVDPTYQSLQFTSAQQLSAHLQSIGIPNELQTRVIKPQEVGELLSTSRDELKEFTSIRLRGLLQAELGLFWQGLALPMATDLFVDVLQGSDQSAFGFWPRSDLISACHRAISRQVGQLDLHGAALLTSIAPETFAVIHVLTSLGYKYFAVACQNRDEGIDFCNKIKAKYLNIFIEAIDIEIVPQLDPIFSFISNTCHPEQLETIYKQFSFFNFARPQAIWLDTCPARPDESRKLTLEASEINITVITMQDIEKYRDQIWLEEVLPPSTGLAQSGRSDRYQNASDTVP